MSEAFDLSPAFSDAEVRACFSVMRELRPSLASVDEFVAQVIRQRAAGYRLLATWQDGFVLAVAGYRIQETLLHGKHLYVDDLVAAASRQSQGFGTRLLQALTAEAHSTGCGKLVLGTGLANVRAHRFYYRQGLLATGLGFAMSVG